MNFIAQPIHSRDSRGPRQEPAFRQTLWAKPSKGGKLLSSDDAGNSCQIVGYTDIDPRCGFEQYLNSRQAIVAQFDDQNTFRLETFCRFGNEFAVEFRTVLAAVKGHLRLVFPYFSRKGGSLTPSDVRRV